MTDSTLKIPFQTAFKEVKQKPNKFFLFILAAFLFLLFYAALFRTKENNILNQLIIWGVGPLVAFTGIMSYLGNSFAMPKELKYFGYFILSCLLGLLVVEEPANYFRYYRLLLTEFVLIVVIIVAIYRHDGLNWVLWGLFLASLTAITHSLLLGDFQETLISEDEKSFERTEGLFSNSNGFANMARTGILTGLFLFVTAQSKIIKIVLLGSFFIMFIAILASGSRGNLISTGVIFTIFISLMYFKKNPILGLFFMILFGLMVYGFIEYILPNTTTGRRLEIQGERGIENESRVLLLMGGLDIFWSSPIFGIGLNQTAHVMSQASHHEMVEILASTGLFGFIFYYSYYYFIYTRLSKLDKLVTKGSPEWDSVQVMKVIFYSHLFFSNFSIHFVVLDATALMALIMGYSYYLERKLQSPSALMPAVNLVAHP